MTGNGYLRETKSTQSIEWLAHSRTVQNKSLLPAFFHTLFTNQGWIIQIQPVEHLVVIVTWRGFRRLGELFRISGLK